MITSLTLLTFLVVRSSCTPADQPLTPYLLTINAPVQDLKRFNDYKKRVEALLGKTPDEVRKLGVEPAAVYSDKSYKGGVTWTLSVESLEGAFHDALPTQIHFIDGQVEAYRIVVNGHVAKRRSMMASPHPWDLDEYDPSYRQSKMYYEPMINLRGSDAAPLGLDLEKAMFYIPHEHFRYDGPSLAKADWIEHLEEMARSSQYGESNALRVCVPVKGSNDVVLLQSSPREGGAGDLVGIERSRTFDKDGAEVVTSRYVMRRDNWLLEKWFWCVYVGRRQECAGLHPNIPSPKVKSKGNLTIGFSELRKAAEERYK